MSGVDGIGGGLPAGLEAQLAAGSAEAGRVRSLADSVERAEDPTRVREAARAFEALLASMLVKEMRASLEEGFFGSGPGADTYSGMLDEKLGEELAEQGLFGMAELLEGYARARVDAEVAP